MIRPKPTIFLVHLPNTKTQNKKPRPRLIQEARMLFNDFAYIRVLGDASSQRADFR